MTQVSHVRGFGGELDLRRHVRPSASVPAQGGTDVDWRLEHARQLLAGDVMVLVGAFAIAQLVRFGGDTQSRPGGLNVPYPALGIGLVVVWWLSLHVHQTRDSRVVGHGAEEYRRIVVATFRAFAVLAMLSVAFEVDASRLYLATAFPLGLVALLVERRLARRRLHRARRAGGASVKVLVVGGERSAGELARWFARHPTDGFEVSGVWIPDEEAPRGATVGGVVERVPVMPSSTDFARALAVSGAGAVVVTDTEHLGHESLRDLTWQLEGTGIDLMLSPNVLDVASSRLYLHDLSGMPMLQVAEPQYAGASRLAKTMFDLVGALLLVIVLAPFLVVVAAAVKATSPGPVFYRQQRVGQGGTVFDMIKFRSMRQGADAELAALLAAEGKNLGELPKLTADPRVTRLGAFIRRFSIDELPQLFNVLKGDMSLVGPRPQRHFEVERYDHVATRRLTVRPGMTGLWQVSGRSDVSYVDAIRLDVHYVENWSMITDLVILWRTARAVSAGDGAY